MDGTGETEDQKRDEEIAEDLRRRVKMAEHLKRAADRYAAEADVAAQEATAELAQAKADIARLEATAAKLTLALRDADERREAAYRAGREDALRWAADQIDPGSREVSVARRVDRGMVFVVDADRGTATKLRLWADQQARDGVQSIEEQRACRNIQWCDEHQLFGVHDDQERDEKEER